MQGLMYVWYMYKAQNILYAMLFFNLNLQLTSVIKMDILKQQVFDELFDVTDPHIENIKTTIYIHIYLYQCISKKTHKYWENIQYIINMSIIINIW